MEVEEEGEGGRGSRGGGGDGVREKNCMKEDECFHSLVHVFSSGKAI